MFCYVIQICYSTLHRDVKHFSPNEPYGTSTGTGNGQQSYCKVQVNVSVRLVHLIFLCFLEETGFTGQGHAETCTFVHVETHIRAIARQPLHILSRVLRPITHWDVSSTSNINDVYGITQWHRTGADYANLHLPGMARCSTGITPLF
jgi:hypothetical protein